MSASDSDFSDAIPENTNRLANESHDHRKEATIFSFGYRYGVPRLCPPNTDRDHSNPYAVAGFILDVRALSNPPKSLRTKETGLSKSLQDAVLKDAASVSLYNDVAHKIRTFVESLEPEIVSISIGIGCEMGRHRSVSVVEKLFNEQLLGDLGWTVTHGHRDILKTKKDHTSRRYQTGRDRKHNELVVYF